MIFLFLLGIVVECTKRSHSVEKSNTSLEFKNFETDHLPLAKKTKLVDNENDAIFFNVPINLISAYLNTMIRAFYSLKEFKELILAIDTTSHESQKGFDMLFLHELKSLFTRIEEGIEKDSDFSPLLISIVDFIKKTVPNYRPGNAKRLISIFLLKLRRCLQDVEPSPGLYTNFLFGKKGHTHTNSLSKTKQSDSTVNPIVFYGTHRTFEWSLKYYFFSITGEVSRKSRAKKGGILATMIKIFPHYLIINASPSQKIGRKNSKSDKNLVNEIIELENFSATAKGMVYTLQTIILKETTGDMINYSLYLKHGDKWVHVQKDVSTEISKEDVLLCFWEDKKTQRFPFEFFYVKKDQPIYSNIQETSFSETTNSLSTEIRTPSPILEDSRSLSPFSEETMKEDENPVSFLPTLSSSIDTTYERLLETFSMLADTEQLLAHVEREIVNILKENVMIRHRVYSFALYIHDYFKEKLQKETILRFFFFFSKINNNPTLSSFLNENFDFRKQILAKLYAFFYRKRGVTVDDEDMTVIFYALNSFKSAARRILLLFEMGKSRPNDSLVFLKVMHWAIKTVDMSNADDEFFFIGVTPIIVKIAAKELANDNNKSIHPEICKNVHTIIRNLREKFSIKIDEEQHKKIKCTHFNSKYLTEDVLMADIMKTFKESSSYRALNANLERINEISIATAMTIPNDLVNILEFSYKSYPLFEHKKLSLTQKIIT